EEIALLGRNYRGDEARLAGLAHEVHAADGFEARGLERLDEFASRDPAATARTKAYLRSGVLERIREQDGRRIPEFLDGWFREETRARVRAIVDDLRSRR
ncbi:MAG TPA: hypothetical protein VD788_03050, partial [Candidatus Polarisedimenticolaceae bacterium]|nr:hypothetical protein [Candidatus Polarisedimenticolaceae bacterium]